MEQRPPLIYTGVRWTWSRWLPLIYPGSRWSWSRGSPLSTLGPRGLGAEGLSCLHWVQAVMEQRLPLVYTGSRWMWRRQSPFSRWGPSGQVAEGPLFSASAWRSPALPSPQHSRRLSGSSWVETSLGLAMVVTLTPRTSLWSSQCITQPCSPPLTWTLMWVTGAAALLLEA